MVNWRAEGKLLKQRRVRRNMVNGNKEDRFTFNPISRAQVFPTAAVRLGVALHNIAVVVVALIL